MNFGLKNLKGKNHLEDLDGDGRATWNDLKSRQWIFLLGSGQGPTSALVATLMNIVKFLTSCLTIRLSWTTGTMQHWVSRRSDIEKMCKVNIKKKKTLRKPVL
jgi:hypothetical protein